MSTVTLTKSVDLLLKAQSGNDEALNQLLARYLPRLRRWARGRLPWGIRSMLDSEDLVQEAIINSLPHVNSLEIRNEHAFEDYLKQGVKFRIIDLFRRGRRRPAKEELQEHFAASVTSPEDAAARAETLERYERALSSLKPAERQAIVLRIELGLSHKEIADQLGKKKPDAARMAVARALEKLAAKMSREQSKAAGDSRSAGRDRGAARKRAARTGAAAANGV